MQLRIFTEPQQGASFDQLLSVAKLTEELGFDAFFRSDHYLAIGGGTGLPGPTDAWVTLAAIGRETSRIRLGTLVTPVTFRFPGALAIQVAQADAMSGGRVELGLGAGWYDAEHAAYGIPFPPVSAYRSGCDHVRTACERIGRDPATMRFTFASTTCVGRDDAEFARRAEAIGQKPEDLRANGAGGTPSEVVDRLRTFAEQGAVTAYLQILDLDDHDHLRLIASEIAPHVTDA